MPTYAFDRLEATRTTSDQDVPAVSATSAPVRRGRRLLIGAGLAVGAVTALALKKTFTPCSAAIEVSAEEQLVSLAEVQTQEIAELVKSHHDPDAVHKWLAASRRAVEAASASNSPAAQEVADKAQKAVAKAMEEKDPVKARKLVKKAMVKAVARSHHEREALKHHLSADKKGHDKKGLRAPLKKPTPSPQERATIAECVFNVEQAATQIAALAANIADATKTCVKGAQLNNTQGRTCIVNLGAIGYSVSTVAGALSMAAENCATTVLPNTDALCSGSISGIVAQVSQLAGAAALTNEMCDPVGKNDIPAGSVPSHLGRPEPAQARRLLFGGGYGADATQCAVDSASVMWWLAQAGLAINAAANTDAGASCPGMENRNWQKGPLKELRNFVNAACTIDIAGAVFAFGQVIEYLQFAVAHCSDQLNVNALCGAGIDGMVSSLAGIASTGPALWTTCVKMGLEDGSKARKAAINMAAMASKITGNQDKNKLSLSAFDQSGNFGRRLSEEKEEIQPSGEDAIKELKKRFATPEDAWRSIGYDFDDAGAEWRKSRPQLRPEELVSLLEEPATIEQASSMHKADGGLLGSMQMCTPQA